MNIYKIRQICCMVILSAVLTSCASWQRKMLFHPTHHRENNGLQVWKEDEIVGFARVPESPKRVFLMLHGNAGQAADREYALECFRADDAVYIMEYPGYGLRPGAPKKNIFNDAAKCAYSILINKYTNSNVVVIGESIGSGPACSLASLSQPPKEIILIVPYDRLSAVASHHFPWLPMRWLMLDDWNNVKQLKEYGGRVKIYAARDDKVIPYSHAMTLSKSVSNCEMKTLNCGHNDWSEQGLKF